MGLEEVARQLEGEQSKREADSPAKEEPRVPTPKPGAFAALHRQQKQFAAQQQEWAQKRDADMAKIQEWEQLQGNAKQNPFAALKLLGFEDPTEFLKNIAETGGKWTPEQQKVYELEKKLADREKREADWQRQQQEDVQAKQYEQKVDAWHKELANYARSSDRWKGTLAEIPGTEQLAFAAIAEHHANTGETMQYDTAFQQVTQNLQGQLVQSLEAVAATSQGRDLLTELAKKLGIATATASRGKPTPAHKQGLSGPIQQTQSGRGTSKDDLTLDEAVELNSRRLREQFDLRRNQ